MIGNEGIMKGAFEMWIYINLLCHSEPRSKCGVNSARNRIDH